MNGLRACHGKDAFLPWLKQARPFALALQEVRAFPDQLPAEVLAPRGYHALFAPAERPGYSGVALYCRAEPDEVVTGLGVRDLDLEGRFLMARFGRLWIASAYFPKGSGTARDNSRVPYKLRFSRRARKVLAPRVAAGERLVVLGDFNTAHTPLDLARPRGNEGTSGFLPEERRDLSRWLASGWVDTFRAFEPGPGHYTWWSQRPGCRARNVGWRIDYALASRGAAEHLRAGAIHADVTGSDHCPLSVTLASTVR